MLAQGALLAMSAALPPDLIDRLTKIIVMFSSPNEGDLIAAGRALQRTLVSANTDIHELAERLKVGRGLSDEDKEQIKAQIANEIANARATGYAEGVRDGQARAQGFDGFHSVDESADWREVALFVEREQDRLPFRTQQKSAEFIADMATRSRSPYSSEPTQRQHEWMHGLFFKLGGKIT
jgi:hypothetical protein